MFVRDIHFGDVIEDDENFEQKHSCLVNIPLFVAFFVVLQQFLEIDQSLFSFDPYFHIAFVPKSFQILQF